MVEGQDILQGLHANTHLAQVNAFQMYGTKNICLQALIEWMYGANAAKEFTYTSAIFLHWILHGCRLPAMWHAMKLPAMQRAVMPS